MRILADRRLFLLLALITAGAFALRLWGIRYGLPFLYVNDEYHEVMRAMELGSGSFNFERYFKGGLYFLLFVEYGVYFVLLKLAGVVESTRDFALNFARDPSMFYLMGRVTVALFGTLNVVLAYLIARRAYTVGAGILAAAFLAVNVVHVDLSHKVNLDVVMTCLASAALLFSIRLVNDGSARNYLWAAAFAALATTTKITAILLVVPLLVAHTYHVRQSGGGVREWISSRHLWVSGGVFAAILLVTNPGIIVAYRFIAIFTGDGDSIASGLDEDFFIGATERPNLFLYYLNVLYESMGWPLLAVCLAGTAYGLWKRTPADVILISFAVVLYLALANTTSTHLYYPRYTPPIIVVLVLMAGRLVYDSCARIVAARPVALTACAGILMAVPAYESALDNRVLTQTDTRTLAKEWIETNIPHGASVFIEGAKLTPLRNSVPLQDTEESMRRRIEYWRVEEPRQAEFLSYKLQVLEGVGFDLKLVSLEDIESLASYRQQGIEYFVVDPQRLQGHRRRTTRAAELLHDLRSADDVALIKTFEADESERLGPTIEIYQRIARANSRQAAGGPA
jgi:4-amino-4-deoxy-L-arabinose transferase-like glycosyltransferase